MKAKAIPYMLLSKCIQPTFPFCIYILRFIPATISQNHAGVSCMLLRQLCICSFKQHLPSYVFALIPPGFSYRRLGQNQRKPCVYAVSLTLSYYNTLVNSSDYTCRFHLFHPPAQTAIFPRLYRNYRERSMPQRVFDWCNHRKPPPDFRSVCRFLCENSICRKKRIMHAEKACEKLEEQSNEADLYTCFFALAFFHLV